MLFFFFFSSRRRHTRFDCDWSSDVCSSDLTGNSRPFVSPDGRWVASARQGKLRKIPVDGGPAIDLAAADWAGGGWGRGSGERRVGEEGRSRGAPDHLKKKKERMREGRSRKY